MSTVAISSDEHHRERAVTILLPPRGTTGNAEGHLIDLGHLVAVIAALADDEEDHDLIARLAGYAALRITTLKQMAGTLSTETACAVARLIIAAEGKA